jgi:SAM-dependent methyltransferase
VRSDPAAASVPGSPRAPATRPPAYYKNTRLDVLGLVRDPAGIVLDVGCGAGLTGEALRDRGATKLVGIEVDAEAAAAARKRYDLVMTGDVGAVIEEISDACDTILCLDVLEHLVDPERTLRDLHRVAASGARLYVSVPNARHVSLLRDLFLRGTFGYREWGHRDRTHLKWFTRGDMLDCLDRTGWEVMTTSSSLVGKSKILNGLTANRLRDFLALQWYFVASKRKSPESL